MVDHPTFGFVEVCCFYGLARGAHAHISVWPTAIDLEQILVSD